MCDDGCCIDISYACDGKQHCPDRSDEDFCRNCEFIFLISCFIISLLILKHVQ